MASYDRSSNQSQGGMDNMGSSVENRGFFNKMLRNLSNWGMDKDQLVIKNSITTGVHEEADEGANGANMYDIFSKKVISKILDRKSIAFLDRAYEDKRKILRQYSIKDEIKDFVTEIADECIIYDDNNYFCGVRDLPDEFDNTIKQRYQETFSKLYRNFGFNDGLTAWNYMKNFLIDGYIAYELILDNKQKNIIDMQPIDPMTVVVAADPESGNIIWIQHPDNPQNRRVLLDAQIVYISYSNNNEFGEVSYVENLIRPYNQLKMIEQTRLLFNINQAAIYKKFVIPTNGLTRQQAEQQIYQLMSEYHEDVQWDDRMGTVSINGSTDIPHSKDFWFPNSEAGTPSIDIESPGGIDLNEDAMLQWFFKILKRASKIPFSRFDDDNGGGSLHGDIAEMTRDEIKFGTFIDRIRTLFKELIMKPLKIQMILDFPELKDDNLFHSSLYLEFNSNELFEEWKYLNNLSKKADIASSLSSNLQDNEGNPYLTVEWLIKNVMKMSDADIAENEKYKSQGSAAGGGEGGGDGGGSGGGGGDDFGGGDEGGDFGGGDESGDFGGGDEGGGDEGGGDSGGDAGGGDDPFEF